MKVFQFSPHELEALPKTEDNRLLFQGRTFVKDFNVSQRFYQRIIEQLRQQGDETTFCLVVEMEAGYMAWREVKPSSTDAIGIHATEVTSLDQPPQDASVLPTTKTIILEPNVAQGVQTKLVELEQDGVIPAETSTIEISEPLTANVLSPSSPPVLKYRGAPYASPTIEGSESPVADDLSPQQPPMRQYRGVPYASPTIEGSESPAVDEIPPKRPLVRKYRGVPY
jgi:hypothetical protein